MKDIAYARNIWKYDKGNTLELNTALHDCSWQVMDIYDDINNMTDYFVRLFLDTVQQFIPFERIIILPRDKPWMNTMIKAKIKERNKWHKRWKSTNRQVVYDIFKEKRHETKIASIEAKAKHYDKIKDKLCNPTINAKQYWHLLKSL